ncbi:hypothetical protein L1049_016358 [Liquidambar formosana]|uniref:Endonuclease/exonuclease/phosphatase domain-containing protein n=1 Tax=Liquidambar formosana TaxID=63359 RepID=A0AAP0S5S4_LIQFO
MFSLAPAVPKAENSAVFSHGEEEYFSLKSPVVGGIGMEPARSANDRPKSILKQSPLHPTMSTPEHHLPKKKKRLKVRINLPDNEISIAHSKLLSFVDDDEEGSSSKIASRNHRSNGIMRSPVCLPSNMTGFKNDESVRPNLSILEVLRELDADILALQDVKAVEERGMKPLSDLADALGMNYVFAESWAPEYGNAILSKWPIKRWKLQKIVDDDDFRNVLKATIDVPWTGEVNFHCTQLDHLDEYWRMKQIRAIIQSNDCPHILAGGLNSLNVSDYSSERWTDIVKYYEDLGKPTPRVEVMKFLKGLAYIDSKDFAGECEPVVIIAKGQNVQGTCKYGTRVDYVLASSDSPYEFVPGSYSVISSKGTSDHHIVKVDITKVRESSFIRRQLKQKQKLVRMTNLCSSRGIWRINT